MTTIDVTTVTKTKLATFDAIVMGIRAYNILPSLQYKQALLMEYVSNGGTLVVQYNTNRGLKVDPIGPYPLQLSRDRVTDENAKVTFLSPTHPLLTTPNKITSTDFEGWVQERGLYFADTWSDQYTPILAMQDAKEDIKKGSLLHATYGKGHFIYTGLSFFREFPAGVPGAYRLFANLLAIGNSKNKPTK